MIQRSRFFKAASWMCIALAINVCTYDIVLGQTSSDSRPATAGTVTQDDPGRPVMVLDTPYIQLAQSDTTGISVKTGPGQAGNIRFVLLPGRAGLSSLRPSDDTSSSAGVGRLSGDRKQSESTRIWLLPGRETPDSPGTMHWRRVEPKTDKPSSDVPPLSVADGPLTDEDQPTQPPPVYRRWWFWAIGVFVIGTAAAILSGTGGTDEDDPREDLPDFPGPPDR